MADDPTPDGPDPNEEFDRLVQPVESEFRATAAQRARGWLTDILDNSDGVLTEAEAQIIATEADRDVRTVYRWRSQLLTARRAQAIAGGPAPVVAPVVAAEPVRGQVLIDMLNDGSEAFEFDDFMITLMYMVNGSQSELRRLLIADGFPMPSLATVSRKWNRLPEMARSGSKHGVLHKASKLLYVRHSAAASNDAWQFDACHLDIFVRTPYGTKPIKPWAILMIDDHSRFIVSWAIIPHAMRSADVLAAIGSAFDLRPDDRHPHVLVGGLPELVTLDNESSISSNQTRDLLEVLPTTIKFSPAYVPTAKGKIERLIRTIQEMAVTGMPGRVTGAQTLSGKASMAIHAEQLLEYDEFVRHFQRIVERYNYDQIHSSVGTTPFQAYVTGMTNPQRELNDDELGGLMLPVFRSQGVRRIHHDGIHHKGFYAHPCIGLMVGQTVEIRSWHHRHDIVAVFSDNKFVGLVPRADHLTADERRMIMGQRIDETHAVYHHTKAAKNALIAVGAAIEAGNPQSALSILMAIKGIMIHRGDNPDVDAAIDETEELLNSSIQAANGSTTATATVTVAPPAAPAVASPVVPATVTAVPPVVPPRGTGPIAGVSPRPTKKRPPSNKKTPKPTATAKSVEPDDLAAQARKLAADSLGEEPF